jgi:threonine dehydrogenase-like Zn-dependent dehydrogenase
VFLMAEFAKCTYNKAFQPRSGRLPPLRTAARVRPRQARDGLVTRHSKSRWTPFGMGMADKQIYGGLNRGGSERMRRIFRLMQTGKVDPTPMTTHEFGFDEFERAFRMMESKEEGIIKPLIHFD